MKRSPLNYRTALLFSLGISLMMNVLFLIMFFYGRDAVMPNHGKEFRPEFGVDNVMLHVFLNFLMAFILYMLNFRLFRTTVTPALKWLCIVLATILCTGVLSYIFSIIQIQFQDFGPNPEKFIRGSMFRDSFIATIVMFSSQILYLSNKQQRTALENKNLMAENLKARLTALKHQVDPHFLFNSLNTLNSLIKIDADKAQEYVQQLSHVFRYTLQNKEIITLKEELKYTQAYCHMMQIRYGDSLQFIYKIDERFNPYFVIPLSMRTLVENAIKHNVVSNKTPLTITIATTDNATLVVSNPVQLKKEPESGEGIGLANLFEHYHLMWGKEIVVNATEITFEVIIPLVENNLLVDGSTNY